MPVVASGETPGAHLSPVGFIIWPDMLITVRYTALAAFDQVAGQVHADTTIASASGVFSALLEAMVDRGADILEALGAELDGISRQVFRGDTVRPSP